MTSLCIHRLLGLSCDASRETIEECVASRLREYDEYLNCTSAGDDQECIRTRHLCLIGAEHLWREGLCRPCRTEEEPARIVRRKRRAPYDLTDTVLEPSGDNVTLADFEEVVLDDDGVPTRTFACIERHSYYRALHAEDPSSFPLSARSFANRRDLYDFGATLTNEPWVKNGNVSYWLHDDPQTNRRCIHAIVIKEKYEPRWGHYMCVGETVTVKCFQWMEDLQMHPVPVFIDNVRKKDLRYCGHWNFERLTDPTSTRSFPYVRGSSTRLRHSVFRVALSHYDNRWGPNGETS